MAEVTRKLNNIAAQGEDEMNTSECRSVMLFKE
jgi:hypothetical protein